MNVFQNNSSKGPQHLNKNYSQDRGYSPFKMLSIRLSSASDMDGAAALGTAASFRGGKAAGVLLLLALLLAAAPVLVLTAFTFTAGGDEANSPRISSSTLEIASMLLDLIWLLSTLVLGSLGKRASESKSELGCGLRGGLGLPARKEDTGIEGIVCSRSGEPGVPTRRDPLVPFSDKPRSSHTWLHL